jgi:hypothetical protein
MQLTYRKFDLPLKHIFTISRGSVSGRARRSSRNGPGTLCWPATPDPEST